MVLEMGFAKLASWFASTEGSAFRAAAATLNKSSGVSATEPTSRPPCADDTTLERRSSNGGISSAGSSIASVSKKKCKRARCSKEEGAAGSLAKKPKALQSKKGGIVTRDYLVPAKCAAQRTSKLLWL